MTSSNLVFRNPDGPPIGTGPCAKHFSGTECPFYPKFAYLDDNVYYPACCDYEGCFCQCISSCFTRNLLLHDFLLTQEKLGFENDQCFENLTKVEAIDFKPVLKKSSVRSKKFGYSVAKEECKNTPKKLTFIGTGECYESNRPNEVENACRFCFRYKSKSFVFLSECNL